MSSSLFLRPINAPQPDNFKRNGGLPLPADELSNPPPGLSVAMAQILDTDHAGQLLLGLNALFQGAAQYAIAGSSALAIHQLLDGHAEHIRTPNNLDLLVNPSALDHCQQINEDSASQAGFHSAGAAGKLTWRSPGDRVIAINLIPSVSANSRRNPDAAYTIGDVRTLSLPQLRQNLLRQVRDGIKVEQSTRDLEVIENLLPDQVN